jgi:hypothetical protein
MSELISIWNSKQLVGAKTLPPFIIPNNPNARSIKINNQCRYWLLIGKANTSIIVDRIEPFSHLVFPYEPDISIAIDNSGNNASSLNADLEFVDYSTINGYIGYQKGSTQFSGSSTVTIGGSVNIGNSQLNVGIVGTPTFNIAAGNSITIAGTPTFNVGTMPAVTFAAGSTVQISGTPTMNIGTLPAVTIGNATLNIKLDQTNGNNQVVISGTPSVTITNSSINVAIQGTPTFNLGAGATVAISGTPTFNVGTMPSVTIGNATLNIKLDQTAGNNTVMIGGTPNVTITNSSLNVAIQGTPTFNLGAGATVAISGTPTFNVGTMPSVTIANSTLTVALTGTNNTVNIGNTPSVNINNAISIASGTISVSSAIITNQQLQVSQIYQTNKTFSIPITISQTSPYPVGLQFLANGTLANVHHVDIYIYSPQGVGYKVVGSQQNAIMADGRSFNATPNVPYGITYNGFNSYQLDGNAVIMNLLTIQLELQNGQAALTTPDNIVVYYAIDSNETAIGTTDGVFIKPYSSGLNDASGSITTGMTSQQVLPAVNAGARRYLLFQNLSGFDMWINFGATSAQVGAAGSIWIPPNGGQITFEGTYCCCDYLMVACSSAGAKFTCKYY